MERPLQIEYPDLPVVKKREEFLRLLKSHPVVIVKADTGSGKSTQVPKFLLESGISASGRIGVTEPRRLAALSIADRLREELKDESLVSTRIRFLEEGPKDAPVKVMTDGILLQEFRRDRLFRAYSVIMVDEAHERSLNIDILLGIFKNVLKERPDFRLVIASATLDAKLFEQFYENAAVLEAEGRTFPVQVVYADPAQNPSKSKGDSGLVEEARDAILSLEESGKDHLLCFLPTERDIQDLGAELSQKLDEKSFDVLPLFGRMGPQEQKRVFRNSGKTRIVLATNIAETSLTIPGIAYVVDTGMARVSRYNPQTRIQGLPIEKISQASARQRTGRAGRVKPGICVRLYTEEDFCDREEFTEPEIRRSNLSNVVLQLRSLGLSVEDFPFIQPPPRSAFRGAYKALFELGALSSVERGARVTDFGAEMSRLPMDVALSAVLLRARDLGVLQPAMIVSAALSIQDPRLYPSEEPEREKARKMHKAMGGHKSDFLTFLAEWNGFCREWKGTSWNALRKYCEKHFLHFLRCREWMDLYEQFCRLLKVKFDSPVCPFDSFHRDNLHIAMLYGFLGGIARRDRDAGCYRLVGGREAHLFPGCDLAGKFPDFVLSAEVRETSRVFLTKAAEILPEWIVRIAGDFCSRRWFEPKWNPERGFVEAVEEVSFRGIVLSRSRRVDYGRVNAEDAARIFFLEAVVEGDMARPFPFMQHNERVLESLRTKETRLRRFGICPSEDLQVDFYTSRAPGVFSLKTLRDFIEKDSDAPLRFSEEDWIRESGTGVEHLESFRITPVDAAALRQKFNRERFARESSHGGVVEFQKILNRQIRAELVFDSSREWDGLSLEIPSDFLPELSPSIFAREVSKWREWMLDAFLRDLSKGERKKWERKREDLDDRFLDFLEKDPENSPAVSLCKAFESFGEPEGAFPTLNAQNEHHLRLHLSVTFSGGQEKFPVELLPEWGSAGFFSAVRPAVEKACRSFPVLGVYFGWSPEGFCVMDSTEAEFWQRFYRRTRSVKSEGSPVKAFFQSRLAFLRGDENSDFALQSLMAMTESEKKMYTLDVLENALPRFSGVEFARARKVRSFADISSEATAEETRSRRGLLRLTLDSAYFGVSAFVRAWDVFRETFQAFRGKKKVRREVLEIASRLAAEEKLYARLRKIHAFLFPERASELPDWDGSPSLPTAKVFRGKFSRSLSGNFLKQAEQKQLREALSKAEKSRTDSDLFESGISLQILFENFEWLRYKRFALASTPEEKVEKDDLLRLKERFRNR